MSSSSSTTSSSSSPSASRDENGRYSGAGPSSSRRGNDFERPSSSRRRAVNEVWPALFLEALATQVAIEASRSIGRLAAAPALANLFQVCSTWRAVSRSDLLWHRLTSRIWRRTNLMHATWHEEYMYWHRTARNFRTGASSYTPLYFDPSDVDGDPNGLNCRRLTLSDLHLACGFADGTVRVFDLTTRLHVTTFRPHHRNRLGRFSRAVSGMFISNNTRLIFATLDGDIYVAVINGPAHPRRARAGDVVTNGVLVDFTGCGRWWVGLFAGVPGRAFHIWDAHTEEAVFIGGTLTDPEAVMGWHMLTELTEFRGRVRVTGGELAVACTSSRLIVFDLRNHGLVMGEEEARARRSLIPTCLDVNKDAYIIINSRGFASVRRRGTLDEVSGFRERVVLRGGRVVGCLNLLHALICAAGEIRVWRIEDEEGEYVYSFRERVEEEVNDMVSNERHVALSCNEGSIHLWDFGA